MFKISAKGEYALLFVRFLLKHRTVVRIQETAETLCLSESLLRKIVNDLERAKIVKTVRWRSGGVQILRVDVAVYEVLSSIGEDLSLTVCTKNISCDHTETCTISPVIKNLQRWIDSILKITRL